MVVRMFSDEWHRLKDDRLGMTVVQVAPVVTPAPAAPKRSFFTSAKPEPLAATSKPGLARGPFREQAGSKCLICGGEGFRLVAGGDIEECKACDGDGILLGPV